MNSPIFNEFFEPGAEIDELSELLDVRNLPRRKMYKAVKKAKPRDEQVLVQQIEIAQQTESYEDFKFSYHASRHEAVWLNESLVGFHDENWIDDVVRMVKGGKEASVYLCVSNHGRALEQPYIAAKVYRPRKFRNLRKDHLYREGRGNLDIDGRTILEDRMLRAMSKRTAYGQELLHTSWIGHEFKTMQLLYQVGVDIPRPYVSGGNAILMSYIGDPELPAPTLNTVELDVDEAQYLFERMLRNIDRMLSVRRVHGDLSAFNVLYWEGEISLIDFPQAIDPEENRNAFLIFQRDVRRICEYFQSQGVHCNPHNLAKQLWLAHGLRFQPEVDPRLLDDQDEQDRKYWESMQNG